MVEITAENIADVTGASFAAGNAERVCRGCVIDSRQVETDSIFVAFPGERVDGNDFAAGAIEHGAGAVIMTREPAADLAAAAGAAGAAILTVEDPTEFMLQLASWYRDQFDDVTVVGITGSIGKTTTKDVLSQTLAAAGICMWVTKGNLNNLIGMPLTLLSAPADTQVLILEMGMNHMHEIERLSLAARPDYAVITKVGTSHIGILGSRENIARAKAEITCGMHANSAEHPSELIMGANDDFCDFIAQGFAEPADVAVRLVSTNPATCALDAGQNAALYRNVRVEEDGCPSFEVAFDDKGGEPEFRATKLSIPGAQSVQNAVYAAALAYRLGVSWDVIDSTLRNLTITGRRMEVRRAKNGMRLIDDSYNASPESTAAALDLLCQLPCEGRRIAVLGEIGELGDAAPRMHELVGAYAAGKKLHEVICVGTEDAQLMANAAELMGAMTEVYPDWRSLLPAEGGPAFEQNDLVLVKGSRFVELDRFVEEVC
jgi:UDP-N-acetylmuramoyl-tripeptide--D-alanyl-D-alanine ligase